jgi:hypothetical protein
MAQPTRLCRGRPGKAAKYEDAWEYPLKLYAPDRLGPREMNKQQKRIRKRKTRLSKLRFNGARRKDIFRRVR